MRQVREPIFVACEGPSEDVYCRWVQMLIEQNGVNFALNRKTLRGGGLVQMVDRALEEKEKAIGSMDFRHAFLIADSDRSVNEPAEYQAAVALARKEGLPILWQNPCFEAFLVYHVSDQYNFTDTRSAKRVFRQTFGRDAPLNIYALRQHLGRTIVPIERALLRMPTMRPLFEACELVPNS